MAALRRDEHMVLCVTEMNPGISDDEVLGKAEKEPAILITADKDFGELVFRLQRTTNGVVLVRLAGISSSINSDCSVLTSISPRFTETHTDGCETPSFLDNSMEMRPNFLRKGTAAKISPLPS